MERQGYRNPRSPGYNQASPFRQHDTGLMIMEIVARLIRANRWQEGGLTPGQARDLIEHTVKMLGETHGLRVGHFWRAEVGKFSRAPKTSSFVLSAEQMAAISSGAKAVYADGVFQYRDIFDKPHFGKFRLFYGGRTGTPASGELSFYDDGNGPDEQ
jgi:hypothetical protein